MMANPAPGAIVQVWYNKRVAGSMALHGKVGRVVVVCRPHKAPPVAQVVEGVRSHGPRNHGILIDGQLYAIPCGNLRPWVGG